MEGLVIRDEIRVVVEGRNRWSKSIRRGKRDVVMTRS